MPDLELVYTTEHDEGALRLTDEDSANKAFALIIENPSVREAFLNRRPLDGAQWTCIAHYDRDPDNGPKFRRLDSGRYGIARD